MGERGEGTRYVVLFCQLSDYVLPKKGMHIVCIYIFVISYRNVICTYDTSMHTVYITGRQTKKKHQQYTEQQTILYELSPHATYLILV